MTDLTALNPIGTPDLTDIVYAVENPNGSQSPVKITFNQLLALNDSRVKTETNTNINQDATGNNITNLADSSIKSNAAIRQTKINGLIGDLNAKSNLASPTFTGTVRLPNSIIDGRLSLMKGSNINSASTITLGNGNFFFITGNSTINTITTTGWGDGSQIVLQFGNALTINHLGGSGGNITLFNNSPLRTQQNYLLYLLYDNGRWAEINGKPISSGTGRAPIASPTFTGTVALPNYPNVETTLDGIATNTAAIATNRTNITAAVSLATTNRNNIAINTADIAAGGGANSVIGIQEDTIFAGSMIDASGTATRPSATFSTRYNSTNVPIQSYNFDSNRDEYCHFDWQPAKNWNAGTIKVKALWTTNAGVRNQNIRLVVRASAFDNGETNTNPISGNSENINDSNTGVNNYNSSGFTNSMSIGNSPSKGDLIKFAIFRDISADTLAVDMELISITIQYTIDASTSG